MGAIQDALTGFYVTGGARLIEAMLATAGIIAGVSGGLALGRRGRGRSRASSTPGGSGLEERLDDGARRRRSAPAAFAFASYAPPRVVAARSR